MKRLLLLAACLVATAANAHSPNECDIEIEGNIAFAEHVLTVSTLRGEQVKITENYDLFVDDEFISLDDDQKDLVKAYYQGIEKAVPISYELAKDALTLAGQGVTEAFGEILGHKDELVIEIGDFFTELDSDIKHQFYAKDGEISFRFGDDFEEDFLSPELHDKIENKMESLVERSIGKLLIAIGTQISTSSGSGSFEERMESFAEKIESKMDFEAQLVEAQADKLCSHLVQVDEVEEQLSDSIKALKRLDIFEVENHNG